MSVQKLERKKFVLYFNPEFIGGEKVEIESIDFFTKENGFRAYDILDIEKLRKGYACNIGPLMVWRVN